MANTMEVEEALVARNRAAHSQDAVMVPIGPARRLGLAPSIGDASGRPPRTVRGDLARNGVMKVMLPVEACPSGLDGGWKVAVRFPRV